MSFLDRSYTVAGPGFNRWMVPPAALCVHLCIGQAYAFSVFNLPMTKLIGITQSAPDDWKLTHIMAGLLVIGCVCNALVKAVHHRHHMQPAHDAERAQAEIAALGEPAGV